MDHIDEVYHENYKTMLYVAHKMLGNGYDANDIAQDVFIDFFEKCQSGTQIEYPKSWLYRVTLNKCADWPVHQQELTITVISPGGGMSEHIID